MHIATKYSYVIISNHTYAYSTCTYLLTYICTVCVCSSSDRDLGHNDLRTPAVHFTLNISNNVSS